MVDLETSHCEPSKGQAHDQHGNDHGVVAAPKLDTDHQDARHTQTCNKETAGNNIRCCDARGTSWLCKLS